jgi:MFS family permease
MIERTDVETGAAPHPVALTVLFLPFGMASGYVTVTLAYVLKQSGLTVEQVSWLVALSVLPQTWKVLWAPIVDTALTAKRWYVMAAIATASTLFATSLLPAHAESLWWIGALVFASSVGSSVLAMATECLMAGTTRADQRGRAGGWSQAGNLGGSGLGGGLALIISQRAGSWAAGMFMAAITLSCCLALIYFKEPSRAHLARVTFLQSIAGVGRSVWSMASSRVGYLTLLLFLLPIGTGAASGLWSAVANDWRANADTVALVNGVLGGLISMVGCLVGGRLSDFADRRFSYAAFGLLQAACAVAMGWALKTPTSFVIFTCLYAFLNGFVYAAYAAVALDTIGRSSPATNYNLLASFANIPITYMTVIEGNAQTRWGSGGMLYTEAVLALAAVLVFSVATMGTRPKSAKMGAT